MRVQWFTHQHGTVSIVHVFTTVICSDTAAATSLVAIRAATETAAATFTSFAITIKIIRITAILKHPPSQLTAVGVAIIKSESSEKRTFGNEMCFRREFCLYFVAI